MAVQTQKFPRRPKGNLEKAAISFVSSMKMETPGPGIEQDWTNIVKGLKGTALEGKHKNCNSEKLVDSLRKGTRATQKGYSGYYKSSEGQNVMKRCLSREPNDSYKEHKTVRSRKLSLSPEAVYPHHREKITGYKSDGLRPVPKNKEELHVEEEKLSNSSKGGSQTAIYDSRRKQLVRCMYDSINTQRSAFQGSILVLGSVGAGKSSVINNLFKKNIKNPKMQPVKSSLEKKTVTEYVLKVADPELNASDLTLGLTEAPGVNDAKGTEQDACNFSAIKKFYQNHPKLKGCFPNLIFLVIDATDNQLEGPSSNLTKCLKYLKKLSLVDCARPNVIGILTHADRMIGKDERSYVKKWTAAYEEKKKVFKDAILNVLGISADIVGMDNGTKSLPQTGDGLPRLLNVTILFNLYEACIKTLGSNGDRLGRAIVQASFKAPIGVMSYRDIAVGGVTEGFKVDAKNAHKEELDLEEKQFHDFYVDGKACIEDIYDMGDLLGQGSFGAVFSAEKKGTGEPCALKRIPLSFDGKDTASHSREADVMSKLSHPNIVTYYPPVRRFKEGLQEYLYMAMELCQKNTLSSYIKKFNEEKRVLQEKPRLLSWFQELCSAIEYIHSKRLIHRDVKPGNVYFSQSNVLKLGDFGLARDLYTESKTSGTAVGTRLYVSPEQKCEKKYDYRTDIYPLGLILYEMLNPQPSEADTSIWDIRERRFPENFDSSRRDNKLIAEILSPEPNERPDIDKIISTIQHIVTVDSPGTNVNPPTWKISRDIENMENHLNQNLITEQQSLVKRGIPIAKATNLGKDAFGSLPKIDNILRSVCMIHWEEYDMRTRRNIEYTGTGFLAKIPGNEEIAFCSAGHNFMDILNSKSSDDSLNRYILRFGNISGEIPSKPDSPPEYGTPMSMTEFLAPYNVSGSISYDGHRALFKNGKLVDYHYQTSSTETLEDYCVLLLNNDDVKGNLKKQGLEYLICGYDTQLECNRGGLVAIFGHPDWDFSREPGKLPLRMSFGIETSIDDIEDFRENSTNVTESCKETKFLKLLSSNAKRKEELEPLHKLREDARNYLYYENDTLSGNAGSPVMGKGDPKHKHRYVVKGIHSDLFNSEIINGAQKIVKIKEWINLGKYFIS